MNQEQKVLQLLIALGERGLSSTEAEDMLRVRDLPKRISVLRQRGINIYVDLKRDVFGQRYARYTLGGDPQEDQTHSWATA